MFRLGLTDRVDNIDVKIYLEIRYHNKTYVPVRLIVFDVLGTHIQYIQIMFSRCIFTVPIFFN